LIIPVSPCYEPVRACYRHDYQENIKNPNNPSIGLKFAFCVEYHKVQPSLETKKKQKKLNQKNVPKTKVIYSYSYWSYRLEHFHFNHPQNLPSYYRVVSITNFIFL